MKLVVVVVVVGMMVVVVVVMTVECVVEVDEIAWGTEVG